MRRFALILFALILSNVTLGCGQKGPLKLPPPSATTSTAASLS